MGSRVFWEASGGWGTADTAMVVAAVALAVGLADLWYLLRRPRSPERHAGLGIRFEVLHIGPATKTRIALHNYGPATAHAVEFDVFGENGEKCERQPRWPESIGELHPGQSYHVPFALQLGAVEPRYATVAWRDGRGERHTATHWLSHADLS